MTSIGLDTASREDIQDITGHLRSAFRSATWSVALLFTTADSQLLAASWQQRSLERG
jgi:hypothetical protein